MKLIEALEIIEEQSLVGDRKITQAFRQIDGRLNQLLKGFRKRARKDPGRSAPIEAMIRVAGDADILISQLERKFAAMEGLAKELHI